MRGVRPVAMRLERPPAPRRAPACGRARDRARRARSRPRRRRSAHGPSPPRGPKPRAALPQQLLRARQVAELRHRDAAQRQRRRIVAQRDPLQRRQRIARRERPRRGRDQRVHRNPVTLVTLTRLASALHRLARSCNGRKRRQSIGSLKMTTLSAADNGSGGVAAARRGWLARPRRRADLRAHGVDRGDAMRRRSPICASASGHAADRRHDWMYLLMSLFHLSPWLKLASTRARTHLTDNQRRPTMDHAIVSREEWLDARKALLAKERAMTHAARRTPRRAPATALGQDREALCLRRARGQVHARRPVRRPQPARHLSLHADAGLRSTSARAARSPSTMSTRRGSISSTPTWRSPRSRACRSSGSRRSSSGWAGHFPWVSSDGSDFNFDFGVSFTPGGPRRRPRDLQLRQAIRDSPGHVRRAASS